MNLTYILNLLFIPASVLDIYYNNNTVIEKVTNVRINDNNLIFSNFFNYYYDKYYLIKMMTIIILMIIFIIMKIIIFIKFINN